MEYIFLLTKKLFANLDDEDLELMDDDNQLTNVMQYHNIMVMN